MKHTTLLAVFLFAVPVVASAATIQSILEALITSLGAFVPVGVAFAVAAFMWGIVSFIHASGDEKAITTGKQRMVWGIVALFFIVSVWGLVALLQEMLDVGSINEDNNCSGIQLTEDSAETCL